jgi:hypothetical protein
VINEVKACAPSFISSLIFPSLKTPIISSPTGISCHLVKEADDWRVRLERERRAVNGTPLLLHFKVSSHYFSLMFLFLYFLLSSITFSSYY